MTTKLPTWEATDIKLNEGQKALTALEQFIYDFEPTGALDEEDFRGGLLAVVQEAEKQL